MLKLVNYVNHLKLLFLSGTPMYNDPKEIIFILNLLHMNDGHGVIYNRDIFDKNDNLIKEQGEKILMEKCNGYISISWENPYNFPFKIYQVIIKVNNLLKILFIQENNLIINKSINL